VWVQCGSLSILSMRLYKRDEQRQSNDIYGIQERNPLVGCHGSIIAMCISSTNKICQDYIINRRSLGPLIFKSTNI
jgi:hypothetical protein